MGQHHASGLTRGTARGHHQRIALLDPEPVVQAMELAVGSHDPGGAQGLEERPAGGLGQPWVERSGGVTGVPYGAQGIDEARSPRQVECNEFRHWQ